MDGVGSAGCAEGITNLVACFHWGRRLLGNLKHHFKDLCRVGTLSGSAEGSRKKVQAEKSLNRQKVKLFSSPTFLL